MKKKIFLQKKKKKSNQIKLDKNFRKIKYSKNEIFVDKNVLNV